MLLATVRVSSPPLIRATTQVTYSSWAAGSSARRPTSPFSRADDAVTLTKGTPSGEPLAYRLLMRTLYLVSCGSSDPTRASIPLHLAVNGSIEVGHDVDVVLAGDATELLRPGVLDSLEGVGVPKAKELLGKAREHEVPIYV